MAGYLHEIIGIAGENDNGAPLAGYLYAMGKHLFARQIDMRGGFIKRQ